MDGGLVWPGGGGGVGRVLYARVVVLVLLLGVGLREDADHRAEVLRTDIERTRHVAVLHVHGHPADGLLPQRGLLEHVAIAQRDFVM